MNAFLREIRLLSAFLVAVLMAPVVWTDTRPILLSCKGEAQTKASVVAELCAAFEAELTQREPSRVVRRADRSEPHTVGGWDVILEVMRTDSYIWEGRLSWEATGPAVATAPGETTRRGEGLARTVGPVVRITAMDAPLDLSACQRFIRDLLKVSNPMF